MKRIILALIGLVATGATAQEAPRFCPNRPDLGASTCTTDPGRVLVELSAFDLQRDRSAGERHDIVLIGDTLVRTGIGPSTELQLSWAAFGYARDRAGMDRQRTTGVGDVRVAVRQNLLRPDGEGFSVAVEPYFTLPTGRQPIGRDGASAGLVVPVGIPLADRWSLGLTGQGSAERDEDGRGRHLALLGIVGLGYAVSERVGVVGELSVARDDDPADPTTQALAAGSIAWQPRETLQLDLLVAAGLNRDSPDVRVAVGGAVLF